MANEEQPVRSLLVPTLGGTFLVPNAAVAEIIGFREAQPVPGAPKWLLGLLGWRDQMIPVLAIESLLGRSEFRAARSSRLIVMHALQRRGDLDFYALLCTGFPRLLRVDQTNLIRDDAAEPESPLVAYKVLIDGQPGEVPDLLRLEDTVAARSALAG